MMVDFRLRDGRGDELGWPAVFDSLLRRLPGRVQFPMPTRTLVRRVEDRLCKEFSQNDIELGSESRIPAPLTPAA